MTKLFPLFLTLFLVFSNSGIVAKSSLKVRLTNGTSKGIGSADTVRVVLLKEAMLPIRELKNPKGSFSISDLDLPDGIPVLIQATYQGANYNKVVPPVPEMRKKEIEIEIFETTRSPESVKTRSLLQLVKAKNELQVFKIYIIQNKSNPPRSYSSTVGLDVFIPKEAENLRGTWTQGNSKMGIPVDFLNKSEEVKTIQRSVLPGNTELQISYTLPWKSEEVVLRDRLFFEDFEKSSERPVFLKPNDMKLNVQTDPNPRELTDEIPEGLKAFMIRYPKGEQPVTISLSGGTVVAALNERQSREIVNGDIIPEWDTALVAVIGILALLFTIQYSVDFLIKRRRH